MNWKNIKTAVDNTYFIYDDKPVFNKKFTEVLKFHSPGLAPVLDSSGAYHIDGEGLELYQKRYQRTFGFYCNRAAVIENNRWYHINEMGEKVYTTSYLWTGNYQEDICTVRNDNNQYYHIDLNGNPIYKELYDSITDELYVIMLRYSDLIEKLTDEQFDLMIEYLESYYEIELSLRENVEEFVKYRKNDFSQNCLKNQDCFKNIKQKVLIR